MSAVSGLHFFGTRRPLKNGDENHLVTFAPMKGLPQNLVNFRTSEYIVIFKYYDLNMKPLSAS